MHASVIGLCVNRYALGRAVSPWLSPLVKRYSLNIDEARQREERRPGSGPRGGGGGRRWEPAGGIQVEAPALKDREAPDRAASRQNIP